MGRPRLPIEAGASPHQCHTIEGHPLDLRALTQSSETFLGSAIRRRGRVVGDLLIAAPAILVQEVLVLVLLPALPVHILDISPVGVFLAVQTVAVVA